MKTLPRSAEVTKEHEEKNSSPAPSFLRPFAVQLGIAVAALLLAGTLADAQQKPAEPAPSRRPMLDELNRETEALYRDVAASLVRVQLPQPRWMGEYAMAPMKNWDKLDPDVRKRLE